MSLSSILVGVWESCAFASTCRLTQVARASMFHEVGASVLVGAADPIFAGGALDLDPPHLRTDRSRRIAAVGRFPRGAQPEAHRADEVTRYDGRAHGAEPSVRSRGE